MYLVGLSPASSQAERELALLKRRLFSTCGHPSFLALPPLAPAYCTEELPDFRLLDAVGRVHAGPGAQADSNPQLRFRIDGETGEVSVVPHPSEALTAAWTALRALFPAGEDQPGSGLFHRPTPSIHLGIAGRDKIETAVGLEPVELSAVRNYRIEVLSIRADEPERYWEAIAWEAVYVRVLGHRRRG